jgi:hypothetical protein
MASVAKTAAPEIAVLLDLLSEAYDRKSWHGPNLRGSLRGVSAGQAARRPQRDRHNIWELALHAAYWKYVVRRRLTGAKRSSFVLPGSNFFTRPIEISESAWKKDLAILNAEHKMLMETVIKTPASLRKDSRLWQKTLHLVRGAAAHDLYHAGQIQLLRRLTPSADGA